MNIAALLVPLHDPIRIAERIATLDILSGGRFTLGLGNGSPVREFTSFGESGDLKVRAAMLDEGLAILEGLFTGLPFSFAFCLALLRYSFSRNVMPLFSTT